MTPPSDGPSGRFTLRFASGERAGETVAITHSGMVLGRRPGTSLQIVEPSVSGRHAELVLDDDGVTLRDLGSTNGTRVGKERIEERRLAHGDELSIGNVRFTFQDSQIGASPPGGAGSAGDVEVEIDLEGGGDEFAGDPLAATLDTASAGEGVQHVSADRVARSSRRSILPLLLILLLPLGGAAAWYFLRQGSAASGRTATVVEPVEGNLLADSYSFEAGGEDDAAWTTDEEAVAAFSVSPGARHSGEQGLVADLAAGEWTRAVSAPVRAPLDGRLELRGVLRLEGAARARLGVRFTSSTGGPSPVEALSAVVGETDGFEELALVTPVPGGYDRAQALVLAVAAETGDGASIDVDDVSLVPSGSAAPAATFEVNRLDLLGEPAFAANLFEIDTVVLSGIAAIESQAPLLGGVTPLVASADPKGVALKLGAGGSADRLVLRAEPAALTAGVATIGDGGFRTHASQFERGDVESLLVGAGRDLVRLAFERPIRVVGRPAGEGFRFELDLRPGDGLLCQLGFREERATAAQLAARARTAEGEGAYGTCLQLWSELLDEFPYELSLVKEAEATRSRLVQEGMQSLQELKVEIERARFFGLADLFREVRASVASVVERFQGSEVAAAGDELVAAIDAQLAGLEDGRQSRERERLTTILRTLEGAEMTGLAAAVEDYLAQGAGPADAEAGTDAGTETGTEDAANTNGKAR